MNKKFKKKYLKYKIKYLELIGGKKFNKDVFINIINFISGGAMSTSWNENLDLDTYNNFYEFLKNNEKELGDKIKEKFKFGGIYDNLKKN